MFNSVKTQEVVVDFNIDRVYAETINSIRNIKGFQIKSQSQMAHSISVSIGMSLFSYGELLSITMQKISEEQTKICFSGQSKLGTEIASNSKNQKNIDIVIKELERNLSRYKR